MFRKQALYYKNKLFLFVEFRHIKKWIDEILNKGFICELTSPATIPLLFAVKLSGSI